MVRYRLHSGNAYSGAVVDSNLSSVQLVPLPAVVVPDWWPVVRDLVEDACKHSDGKYAVADVLDLLLQKRMQIWVAMKNHEACAIGISELVEFPQIRLCRILAATGDDMAMWNGLIEEIENWAIQVGAQGMELITRPGWERVLKKFGYEKTHVQLNKRLGHVH